MENMKPEQQNSKGKEKEKGAAIICKLFTLFSYEIS